MSHIKSFNYNNLIYKTWDNEIVNLIAKIHEYKGRQNLYLQQNHSELNGMIEISKINSIKFSNEIEEIYTSNPRLMKLIKNQVLPCNQDEEEVLGYRDALNSIFEKSIPISSNYILQLHRDLYQYSHKSFGGVFKNTQNYISATDSQENEFVLFKPLEPYETPTAIQSICDSYNKIISNQDIDDLLLIPIFIHDFLCIHPFNDGNGRMSRLLTTLLLYRSGYVIGRYISLESRIAKNTNLYYDALEQCQTGWNENEDDPTPFIKYLLQTILAAYREFEERVILVEDKLSAIEMVRGAVYNKIGKFTKSEVMELCPTLSKASVENAIKQLVEQNLLVKHGSGRNTFYTRSDATEKVII